MKARALVAFLGLNVFASSLCGDVENFIGTAVRSHDIALFSSAGQLEEDDFALQWKGVPPEAVRAFWKRGSLEWVRTGSALAVPRATLVVEAQGYDSGTALYAGLNQPFQPRDLHHTTEVPVLLLSRVTAVHIQLRRGEKTSKGILSLEPVPRPRTTEPALFIDSSCFPYKVRWRPASGRVPHWAFVGCRLRRVPSEEGAEASLELEAVWDGQTDGLPWRRHVSAHATQTVLEDSDTGLTLEYKIPKQWHALRVGLGLGPYQYTFSGPSETLSGVLPIPTLYASHYLNDTARFVGFTLLAVGKNFLSDTGIYFNFDYLTAMDRRFHFRLMLGVHGLAFTSQEGFRALLDLPQGVEFVITNVLMKGTHLTLGGFVQPSINENYYYNVWIRWGYPTLFLEVNYIAWRKIFDADRYESSSRGIAAGIQF